eukprot:1458750-Rhodomonas_salina.5
MKKASKHRFKLELKDEAKKRGAPVSAPLGLVVLLDHGDELANVGGDRVDEGVVLIGVVGERREQLDDDAGRDARVKEGLHAHDDVRIEHKLAKTGRSLWMMTKSCVSALSHRRETHLDVADLDAGLIIGVLVLGGMCTCLVVHDGRVVLVEDLVELHPHMARQHAAPTRENSRSHAPVACQAEPISVQRFSATHSAQEIWNIE